MAPQVSLLVEFFAVLPRYLGFFGLLRPLLLCPRSIEVSPSSLLPFVLGVTGRFSAKSVRGPFTAGLPQLSRAVAPQWCKRMLGQPMQPERERHQTCRPLASWRKTGGYQGNLSERGPKQTHGRSASFGLSRRSSPITTHTLGKAFMLSRYVSCEPRAEAEPTGIEGTPETLSHNWFEDNG